MTTLSVAPTPSRLQSLAVQPVAGHIGAEVENFHLSASLDDEQINLIEAALVKHKVLFFRGQKTLDDREQQAFGARFGKPVAHPTVPSPSGTTILELDAGKGGGRADSWHTDVTFVEAFPKIAILRAITVPAVGGDTVWANTALAYEQLPQPLKDLAEQLWALHSNDYDYGANRVVVEADRLRHHQDIFASTVFEAEHPLVHVHPVSGERALLLGHFIKKILGFSSTESARLFELFQSRATRLENTVRWRWQPGDVAIWDNRTTQHIAINDYGNQPRLVRRVTIEGEPAVAVNGARSRTRRHPQAVNDDVIRSTVSAAA